MSRRPRSTRRPQARPRRRRPSWELLEGRLLLAVFQVTSAADSGRGTLRQAILDSNGTPGPNAIGFAIGSGAATIALQSALPTITQPVTIDGTTQPGYPGTPLIS